MATDFPNSPANGATHTFGGNTYTYNSQLGRGQVRREDQEVEHL